MTAALLAVCVAAWPAVAAAAPPKPEEAPVRAIAILVNGEELARDPAPRARGDRVLVPVVRIYSALGISVARDGQRLVASAPSKRIVITVGSSRATVDNRTIVMDAPAVEIDGATYVPLRFVADSLGAQVSYDPKAERVEVVSSIVGRTPGLEQRTPGGSTQIVGTVSAVDLNSAPESVTVTRGPSVRTIAITSDARIVVQDVVTRTTTPATLRDVHVGDAVSVILRRDGGVDQVVARYASRAGTIAAVSPSAFVLQNGYVVTPDKSTDITLNGQTAALADLKVGDNVTVRLNPDTGEKRQILVARSMPSTPTPAGSAQITDIAVSAKGPLRAGDSFMVTMHGTPGG
ncbi:MAG TPA: copper amine oxidase N-terminal domain-containing protein, partial [Dongiaceae bacterium]|nr:copper amine oxidase N-terminal domain-containing protein [Dongiaceae bacterium]